MPIEINPTHALLLASTLFVGLVGRRYLNSLRQSEAVNELRTLPEDAWIPNPNAPRLELPVGLSKVSAGCA